MITLNEHEQRLCDISLPLKTESYTPIPHYDFIKNMQERISEKGYEITDKKYWNNAVGSKLIGRYTLNHIESDLAMNIGFRNSYDKSMAAGFALGATVLICSNGMISGEHALYRKHTGEANEEMNIFITQSLNKSVENFDRLVNSKNIMKETIFDKSTINELIGRLVLEDETLRLEQLSIVKNEWHSKTPTFDYGVEKNSAWNIYNLCTYAIDRNTHPTLYINQHGKLLSTFEEMVGIEPTIIQETELIIVD